jgi:threonine/homoserine/homoserine lactone efflux protein
MAAAIGFFVALPFGPVNLEIIRKVLNQQTKSAVVFASGAAAGDGLWPVIAFVGVAPWLEIPIVSIIFWTVSTILLSYLGVSALLEKKEHLHPEHPKAAGGKKRFAFIMGFTLVLSNPLNLVAWLTAMGAFHTADILPTTNLFSTIVLWGSVTTGSMTLFSVVIFLVRKYKHFITNSPLEKRVNQIFGPIIILIAIYFAYNLYQAIINY